MGKVITKVSDGLGNQLFQFAMGSRAAAESGRVHVLDVTHFTVLRLFGSSFCRRSYLLDHFVEPARTCKWNPVLAGMFVFVWAVRGHLPVGLFRFVCKLFGVACAHPDNSFAWDPDYVSRALRRAGNRSVYFSACYGFVPLLPDRNRLRKMFEVLDPCSKEERRWLRDIEACDSVSVHVRRTDYLSAGDGNNVLDRAYYENAIGKILKSHPGAKFFFFSDDIDWCRQAYGDVAGASFVSLQDSFDCPWRELRLMGACRHHVIANSTFSWWGAALSRFREGLTIYPKYWFWNVRTLEEMVYSDWVGVDAFCGLRSRGRRLAPEN